MKCPTCKIQMTLSGEEYRCPKCNAVWQVIPKQNFDEGDCFDDEEYFFRHQDRSLENAGEYAFFDTDDVDNDPSMSMDE